MYCLESRRPVQGKRKQGDLDEVAPSKKVKVHPPRSPDFVAPPPLPTPIRSPNWVSTAASPSIGTESSSSDASESCDTDSSLLPPRPPFGIYSPTNDSEGIDNTESVCGLGSRTTSSTSSDIDSSACDSPSEPATLTPEKALPTPSLSNPSFPLCRYALTSQNLSNLQKRLNTFLPALHTANQALEVDRAEGKLGDRNIEIVSNAEEPYIEMDLSLGVLEGKQAASVAGIRLSDESDSESSALVEEGQDIQCQPSQKKGKEKDILGKLLGRSDRGSPKAKPKIEMLS